jgi:prepilin-type N-terminal cleavage/methylation domain-containing protein
MRRVHGFTLVELLVVITIIVVLLALLTPALDQAIYQAELAVCGTKLNAIGMTVLAYAPENRRWYPYRPTLEPPSPRRPIDIKVALPPAVTDDRPLIESYMPGYNSIVQCPLSDPVDIRGSQLQTSILGNYGLWYGWRYAPNANTRYIAMRRLGDRFEWVDAFGSHRFRVLAADLDAVNNWVQSAHPDKDGLLYLRTLQDESLADDGLASVPAPYTLSHWNRRGAAERGPVDRNFVFDDGSVQRLNDLEVNDLRLYPVPERANSNNWPAMRTWLPEN